MKRAISVSVLALALVAASSAPFVAPVSSSASTVASDTDGVQVAFLRKHRSGRLKLLKGCGNQNNTCKDCGTEDGSVSVWVPA